MSAQNDCKMKITFKFKLEFSNGNHVKTHTTTYYSKRKHGMRKKTKA